jgi:DNA-directed RNA polymerase specialized sigma24 family protein
MKGKKKTIAKNGEPWPAVSAKLDTLIRLSALNIVKGMETQKEQIAVLSDAGFQPKEIAHILRTTSGTVRVTLTAIRKERASVKGGEEKEEKPEAILVEAPEAESKPDLETAQQS